MVLYDRQLATSLVIAKIRTAADADRLAIEGESVSRDSRSRSSLSSYLPEGDREFVDDYLEEEEWLEEEEEDITAAVGVLSSTKQNETLPNKPPERQKAVATSSTRCYGCGRYGVSRSNCQRPRRFGFLMDVFNHLQRLDLRFDCALCKTNHFLRNCPKLRTAQQLLAKSESKWDIAISRRDTVPRSSATSAPTETSVTFKRDGTAVLSESEESPVMVLDPTMPAMSEESTAGTPRMKLLFVLGAVQTLPVWILAESGSVRNLIDEAVFKRLSFQPPISDPGDLRVIGGNGEALDLKGFTVLPISLGFNLIWHEFGFVVNLPLEVLIGADVLASHLFSLHYLHNNKKRLQFGVQVGEICKRYRGDPMVGTSTQMKFIDYNPKRRRNRLKIGYNFLATLC